MKVVIGHAERINEWKATHKLVPHSVVGFILSQSAGSGRVIMRRLTRIDLVLKYVFQESFNVGKFQIIAGEQRKMSFSLLLNARP
jgi:hypothetical protein